MGPSGCGKTTLLNVLAHRDAAIGARVEGVTLINGSSPSDGAFRRMTCYVEQEDALIGSLTVRETLHFAARLAHKKYEPCPWIRGSVADSFVVPSQKRIGSNELMPFSTPLA